MPERSLRRAGGAPPRGAVMGVDPGARTHCWITATIDGMPTLVGAYDVAGFAEVDELMARFGVRVGVVDAQPERQAAEAFKQRWRGRAYLCSYVTDRWPATWASDRDPHTGHAIDDPHLQFRVQVDRTAAMDAFVARLRGEHLPVLGWQPRFAFAADAEQVPGLFAQLQAPVRLRRTNSAGIQRAVYDEGAKADHYFHAGVYALLAEEIAGAEPALPPLYAG